MARNVPAVPHPASPFPTAARSALSAVLALCLLNAALAFRNWWPTPGIVPDARLAPEFVALWLLLLALVTWRGVPTPRAITALTLGWMLLALGRYADVTVPTLFGRAVNLYWDGQQIPRFVLVSARGHAWWVLLGIGTAAVAGAWALFALLRWSMQRVALQAVPYALRARWTWWPTLAAASLVVAHQAGAAPALTWHLVTHAVTPTYVRQARLLATAFSPRAVARELPRSAALDAAMAQPPQQALGALRGRDVNLLFLESYGAVAFEHPHVAPALAASRRQLAHDIAVSGRLVASAYVRASTFAGASELSHLSLLTGVDLSNPLRHDLMLTTSDRPTLIGLLARAGYRSVGLYPALSWDWDERAFYNFDTFLDARDLPWRGPPLGYWKVPDQYSLAYTEQQHGVRAGAPPRLLFFPTITSHLPFGPVPPVQPDRQRLLSDDPFGADASRALLAEHVDWNDMQPNYVRIFDYTYRWLGDWLQQPEARESVMLWLGDHQPAASVSGPGAGWEVPVHIVTRDRALLERFIALGFVSGLEPQMPALGGMHDLTTLLLRGFDGTVLGLPATARARPLNPPAPPRP
jgi:hypothetical protein